MNERAPETAEEMKGKVIAWYDAGLITLWEYNKFMTAYMLSQHHSK